GNDHPALNGAAEVEHPLGRYPLSAEDRGIVTIASYRYAQADQLPESGDARGDCCSIEVGGVENRVHSGRNIDRHGAAGHVRQRGVGMVQDRGSESEPSAFVEVMEIAVRVYISLERDGSSHRQRDPTHDEEALFGRIAEYRGTEARIDHRTECCDGP